MPLSGSKWAGAFEPMLVLVLRLEGPPGAQLPRLSGLNVLLRGEGGAAANTVHAYALKKGG